jgi:hypothetical protein
VDYLDPKPNKSATTWRAAWRSLTKAAGLKGFRYFDLRHHCVTELSEGGNSDVHESSTKEESK